MSEFSVHGIVSENERLANRSGGRQGKNHRAENDFIDRLAHFDGQEYHCGGFLRDAGLHVREARKFTVQTVE